MEAWNHIINTALPGTAKKTVDTNALPGSMSQSLACIAANSHIDSSEKFLQTAALVYNYCQSGVMPLTKEGVALQPAPEEVLPVCNTAATQALEDILAVDHMPLLALWLQHCKKAGRIAPPALVPALLQTGIQQKKLQPFISACCGKRGEWLCRFNDAWQYSATGSAEEIWQTGSPEQRKALLQETRLADAAKALAMLQQTWPQEDAATRADLLKLLAVNIGAADIAFLESCTTEKSKKVKEEALTLLRQIPQSPIVQQYCAVLAQTFILKKEKALLGLSSKTVLQATLPEVMDETVFKSGIDKLSSSKQFTDAEYIIYQLIQQAPPSFWEAHLQMAPQAIIELFQKSAATKKFIPALLVATTWFKDQRWALAFIQQSQEFYTNLVPLLPVAEQEAYSLRFFKEYPAEVIQHATHRDGEWNIELATRIIEYTATNVYQYNRHFYNLHVHNIPTAMASRLAAFTPADEYQRNVWANTIDHITQLLRIKEQLITSFNA